MSSRPKFAAAIITLNEDRHLPACLDSLAWVDEVVVVDSGSTDATVAIARLNGARVLTRPFTTFADQRNAALARTTAEWVLFIDADERVTPKLRREIERAANPRTAAYRVPIRSRIFGRRFRFSGTQDDRPLRLLRRGCGRWEGDVHETLAVQGPCGQLRGWLEHETSADLRTMLAKVQQYTSLAAQARVAAGRRARWSGALRSAVRETARRLFWKQGWLDGPAGWAFCLLSGFSEWVLVEKQRRLAAGWAWKPDATDLA